MEITNTIEYLNFRELRRRFVSTLEIGRKKLTGTEFEAWAPQIDEKIQEIDRATEDFYLRSAFEINETIATPLYARICSRGTALTPLQPSLVSSLRVPFMQVGNFAAAFNPTLPFPPVQTHG